MPPRLPARYEPVPPRRNTVNTTVIVVAVLVIVAVLALFFLRKSKSSGSGAAQPEEIPALTPEQKELLRLSDTPGEDGLPFMFALTTCRHCKKTKEYLDSNDAKYHLLYVDEFHGKDRTDLMDKVRSYNPRGSFPTIVLPGGKVVVGFREQLLREALFHDSAVIAESSQGNS